MTNPHLADIDVHRKANTFYLMDANSVEVLPRFTLDISVQLMIWFLPSTSFILQSRSGEEEEMCKPSPARQR